jgi:hypothetical protein
MLNFSTGKLEWELPPSSISIHMEPEPSPLPISTNLAKKKKMQYHETHEAAFKCSVLALSTPITIFNSRAR